ncbi:MAG: hypothetical protein ACI90V_006976 [Bacillariaceae sp.]|jgi:hypothetical protein
MALMLLAGAGYAIYRQQQEKEPTKEFKDYELDPAVLRFFNDEKDDETTTSTSTSTSSKIGFIEFLPSELTMGQYSNSLTTITFYEGDYLKIKSELECRINEVLKVNPWLGGRLVVKPGEEDLKLWYDSECNDVPSNIYTCHEPGVIPLKRSTKYGQYKDYLPDYSVCVPSLQGLIGTNHPVFKVTVVPDVIEHHERFAIIVSQSHMIGDAHTYYKIFHMLFNSKKNNNGNENSNNNNCRRMINTTPVEQMNPIRRSDVKYHIEKHMGIQEASYIDKTHPNMVDEMVDMVASKIDADNVVNNQKTKKKTMLFTVNEKWLKAKTKECIEAKKEELLEKHPIKKEKIANKEEELKDEVDTFSKNLENQNTSGDLFFQDDELNRPNHGTTTTTTTRTQSSGSMASTNSNISSINISSTRSISSSSVNDEDEIHPTDVLLSWWFNTSDADIGLIPHHLRKKLNVLSEMDAGNYNTPIPYTKADYKTPHQIHESIKKSKRVFSEYFETPLPRITTGYTFAMGVDWCKLYSGRFWNNNNHNNNEKYQDGSTNEKDNDDIVDDGINKDLHVPFFTDHDIAVIPTKMDVCLLFTAKTGRQQKRRGDELDDDGYGSDDIENDDEDATRIGVLIVATEAICDKVAECGIIDEDMKTSKTAAITSNRRGSYVDFESLSVEMVLSEEELNEDEDVDEAEGGVDTIVGIDNKNGNGDIGTRKQNREASTTVD